MPQMQFGVNHLAHFTLLRSFTPQLPDPSKIRIVMVSSKIDDVELDLDNLNRITHTHPLLRRFVELAWADRW